MEMSSTCTCRQIGREKVQFICQVTQACTGGKMLILYPETFTLVIVQLNLFPGILLGSHQVADSKRLEI